MPEAAAKIGRAIAMAALFRNWPAAIYQRLGPPATEGDHLYTLRRRSPTGRLKLLAHGGRDDAGIIAEAWLGRPYEPRPEFHIQAGWRITDLGAHVGAFATMAATIAPDTEIFAVEPENDCFRMLAANVAMNQLSNVRLLNAALAPESGEGILTIRGVASHALAGIQPGDAPTQPVRTISLEPLLTLFGSRVDLLKVDIEGSEYDALAGADPALLAHIGRVAVKCHATRTIAVSKGAALVLEFLRRSDFMAFFDDRHEIAFGYR